MRYMAINIYSKYSLKFYDENFHDKEPVENLTGSLLLFFILFSD